MSTQLPAPEPIVNPDTEQFWAATKEGTLLVQRCGACGQAIWSPRALCPACHSDQLEMTEATGRGTVYSFTEVSKGMGDYAGIGSYVLAYVELDEGPRVMTNIVDADPGALQVGDAVEVVFSPAGESGALPRFRPAS
ncbi:nucleotide-binding protein [Epidermidibacterium keratini]|uniref:Nucleotide-binding protein n=1 Tax=Epidermidibacterium keratini TaxID=1891644 RepID=A0A7L4YSU3_9ACTN|nr:Zn-ribbon domain-containing OB-fold protein [Epidermidibacterium keratini]QHC02170.1 nucleotide-binding protein [Epidermidibacterium keratini]